MAENFLTRTTLSRESMLQVSGRSVLERHAALREVIAARVSEEAASLFAEPVLSRGNDEAPPTVSWYVPWPGEGRRLSSLSGELRARAEALLTQRLVAIGELLDSPDYGLLAGAALHVGSEDDIWVVDGQPVLVNWGTMPPEEMVSRARRDRHFAGTTGRFLPLAAAPAVTAAEREGGLPQTGDAASSGTAEKATAAPVAGASAGTVPNGLAAAAAHAAETPGAVSAPEPARQGLGHWLPLVFLLLLSGAVLYWLMQPGVRLFPPPPPPELVDDASAVAIAEEINRSLESRAAALEAAIAGATCTDSGRLVLPDGHLPDGTMPPAVADGGEPPDPDAPVPVTGEPLLPTAPDQVTVEQGLPGDDGTLTPRSTDLLELLEQQTVLVLVRGVAESGTGSGFFVGPDLVLTNQHVVAPALAGGEILVANKSLGRLHRAGIVAAEGPLETTGKDIALLRVAGTRQPYFALRESSETMKLRRVVAAGYPAAIIETDPAFEALLAGDASAIPEMSVTEGIVNTEQNFGGLAQVLIHTARISPGNSGGPLVDGCGRVVGVNTFGRTSDERHLNFSVANADVLDFLGRHGQPASTDAEPCTPRARPSGAVDVTADAE